MQKFYFISIIALLFVSLNSVGQEFKIDDQYAQAMKNAKQAFEAKQYSHAVLFYREALKIKPNELLPKYKIEDIRTIYIKKELDKISNVTPEPEKKKKRKPKKEELAQKEQIKQKAEEKATNKMNQEAEQAKQELITIIQKPEKLDINEVIELETETEEIAIVPNREANINQINKQKADAIKKPEIQSDEKQIIGTIREIPKEQRIPEPKPEEKTKEPIKEPIQQIAEKTVTKTTPVKTKPATKDASWIKEENGRLAKEYPKTKTIEEIEKPGKHITRIIMNIEGKVTIYLKVRHSWGATFFFIKEVGLDPKSISEAYFNLKTNLKTYEH